MGNGTTETRGYDGRYVPQTIELDAPSARLWDYTTDGVGNILEIETRIGCLDTDLVLANQTVTGTEAFESCAGIEAGPAFSVEPGGSATFTAGTRIALGSGFSVETGASFAAGIDPSLAGQVETRTYAYQDFQYFLTGGDGPWGNLTWSYDRIGNRLTETRDGTTDTYAYVTNPASGNTAVLDQITLGIGGTRGYQFGAAGHLEQVTAGANQVLFASDDEGRLADLSRPVASEAADFEYDGRSFLQSATDMTTGASTQPSYSSEGLLHALARQSVPAALVERFLYLHFAGRPVAQLKLDGSGGHELRYLVTDHLGTPFVALDEVGTEIWDSAFEPFGRDFEEGSPDGALATEIFLRFPGQWEDGVWAGASLGATTIHNLHRWYLPTVGTYSRTDPWGIDRPEGLAHLYAYGDANPLTKLDPEGLISLPFFDFDSAFDCFYCLLFRSNFGFNCTEEAAWIVLDTTKSGGFKFSCVAWPPTGESERTSYRGRIPPATVGQAHTHPIRCPKGTRRGQRPSKADRSLADNKGFPVCSLSTTGVWCYDPNTKKTKRAGSTNWSNAAKKRTCEPCDGIPTPP